MVDQTARYIDRVFPRRWRILGVRLRPFTIGHAHVLAGASAWRPFQDFEIDDSFLVTALYVCSRNWRMAKATLDLAGGWFAIRLGLSIRRNRPDLSEKAEVLSEYLVYSTSGPAVTGVPRDPKLPAPRQAGAPTLALLRLFAAEKLGLGPSKAMHANFSETFWMWATWLEEQGHARIRNQGELEFDKFVAEATELHRRREGAPCPT